MIDPLPSYGRGRDTAGGRYISLIFGTNLTDVIITGTKNKKICMFELLKLLKTNTAILTDVDLINKFGDNVLISGENGTIDGQGALWWDKFHKGELQYTRPYLIEIMYSDNIQISNLTLVNSPSWNVHPVYSRFFHSAYHVSEFSLLVFV